MSKEKRTIQDANRLTQQDWYTEAQIDAMVSAVGSIPNTRIKSKVLAPDGKVLPWRTTTRREELSDRGAAGFFIVLRDLQSRTSPSRLAARSKSLATAAVRLSSILQSFDPRTAREQDDTDSARLLVQAIRAGVRKQHGYADTETPDTIPETQSPRPRRSGSGASRVNRQYETIIQWVETINTIAGVANFARSIADKSVRSGRQGDEARNKGDRALRWFVDELKEIYRDVFKRDPGTSQGDGQAQGPFIRFVDAALRPLGVAKTSESIAGYVYGRGHTELAHTKSCSAPDS